MNIEDPRADHRMTRNTMALILAGGRGARLMGMTRWRSKPAVPFAGKFKIIDFPLSNCLNSGIRRIGVLTQYKAHTLILHIQNGWGFLRGEINEFVEILPAQQRISGDSWYEGTSDAVYQNLDILRNHNPEYILVLAGDHVYKMDYGGIIAFHWASGADITVGCIEIPRSEAQAFGVMVVDEEQRIVHFQEKPEHPESIPGRPDVVLGSMGIYVFKRDFLFEQLEQDARRQGSSHDFAKDIIPVCLANHNRVMAYPFRDVHNGGQGYWRDVGTVDAFWEANLELVKVTPPLNLYDETWPIWTYQEQLPPAKFVFDDEDRRGMAVDSMVSGGCVISGATIRRSLLFSSVRVNSYASIRDSVLLPGVDVGRHARVSRAVVDCGCRIPNGMVIGENLADDLAKGFHVTDHGVVLVCPEMLGQKPSAR